MAAIEELRRRVEEVLRRVPADYVVARTGSLCWNLCSTEPIPHEIDLGWDLLVNLRAGQFELTHSNDWRQEPMFFHRFDERPTDKITVPNVEPPEPAVSASYLPLTALDREGALLAFILDVVRTFPPNTDCPT